MAESWVESINSPERSQNPALQISQWWNLLSETRTQFSGKITNFHINVKNWWRRKTYVNIEIYIVFFTEIKQKMWLFLKNSLMLYTSLLSGLLSCRLFCLLLTTEINRVIWTSIYSNLGIWKSMNLFLSKYLVHCCHRNFSLLSCEKVLYKT